MEIVATAYSIEELNKLKGLATFVLLPVEGFTSSRGIDLSKALLICEKNDIKPILRLDAMLHENMLSEFESIILSYKESNALYYVTDLGACNILITHKLQDRTIFDPQTLICNYLDASIYQNMGFNAISMSLEITIDDVIKTLQMTNIKLFYQVFGHRLMFHSKRKLVSRYENKGNLNIIRNGMYLIEEKRNDKYPLIETNLGTYIYRSYQISLLNELNRLNLSYAYLESRFIDFNVYIDVLKIYNDYLNNNITLNDANECLSKLPLNIEDGFKLKDSVYQKEEF